MAGKMESSIPVAKSVVHQYHTGILTSRQKLWTRARPNDRKIENPVLRKLQKDVEIKGREKPESFFASQEVRGLSSEFKENEMQESTGILTRIQASRRERHDATLEAMFQELSLINSELEPQISEACSTVKEYLSEDQNNAMKKMQLIEKDEDLIKFTHVGLDDHWEQIQHHTLLRQSWIEELQIILNDIETDRAMLIQQIYKEYTQKLTRIAHCMPTDVLRYMEDECLATNETLIANKRYGADLIRKLKMSNLEKERKMFFQWENRVADWKRLKVELAISGFNKFMTCPGIAEPLNVQRAMNSLFAEQTKLNERRMELFALLKEMKPPGSTKSAVFQWQTSLTSITEQLDDVHKRYYGILKLNFDKVIRDCEEELARVKISLHNEAVCPQDEIEIISTEQLLPLVGEKRSRYDYELEKYAKYTEEVSASQKQMIRILFRYLQFAAQIWDAHEIGLAKEEREFQERLDQGRKEHDTQNQIKEAKFDIAMDRMRQEASEEGLEMSLKQCLEMLDEIKKSYHEFHELQVKTAKEYPSFIAEEVKTYEESMCEYFKATRITQKKVEEQGHIPEEKTVEEEEDKTQKYNEDDSHMKTSIIKLSSGVRYKVIEDKEEMSYPPDTSATTRTNYTFLTDDLDEVEVMPYVSSFEISEDFLQEIRQVIRREFLEHIESWRKEAIFRAESIMTAKIEELNNELDLRLHLHEPRQGRAEKDVHNVRAAELVLHKDRVNEHCQGILSSLLAFKSRFFSMIEEHDEETEKFKNSVESLENTFVSARKSHELTSIKDEVANQLDEYMKVIRASLRKFRQDLDEMLNNLRNSNARFRKMLKIFSEGGNFCPEEVDEFRKKLENMAGKIDNAEGSLMAELEGMETKRLDAAHECAGKLEERFKYHLFDLTFLEKISRWLTNTQVKIKSEVADSNSQSLVIAKCIATFDRRIDAVLRPNLDREQITASGLHETLMPILKKFHERVRYLDCAVHDNIPSSVAEMQVKQQETKQDEVKPASKRSKKQKASDTNLGRMSKSKVNLASKPSGRRSDVEQRPTTVPVSKPSSKGSLLGKVPSEAESEKTVKTKLESNSRSINTKLSSKFDKKYLVFSNEDEVLQDHFLSRITRICADGLDGLLLTSDMYYRQKGNRAVTRPSAIHDTFDLCADSLVNRLLSYQNQAADYHNTCIQELRAQAQTFGKSLLRFPQLVVSFTYNQHLEEMEKSRHTLTKEFNANLKVLDKRKQEHQTLLRPTLGHPCNRNELGELKLKEETRTIEFKELLQSFEVKNEEILNSYAKKFVEALNALTEKLLRQFDVFLTTSDIQQGKIIPKPKTEKQLLRDKMNSAKTEESIETQEDEKIEWRTLVVEALIDGAGKSDAGELIKTQKITKQHEAVIQARNNVFNKFCANFKLQRNKVKVAVDPMKESELKWNENWNRSIQKILELY